MKKIKLLMAACALILGSSAASAQVYIETDLTSQFNSLATTQWTGASGQVGWAAPQVTTNSGLTVAAWERYNGSCDWTGDIMYTSVTGLTAGTYKIELYGAAAFTFGRGFGSTAFTGDFTIDSNSSFNENDYIDTNTGVTLYATTSEGTVSQEIPIYYATNFNTSGIATAVLNNVVVGSNGQIKIGLSKTSTSTNWHVVQLKGVTATVDAVALFNGLKAEAEALYSSPMNATVFSELQAAANVDLSSADADGYIAAIDALQVKVNAAKASVANYAEAKEILDAADGYDAAGQASYAANETVAAIKAAYENGTLEAVTAEQKAAAQAALVVACKAQTQPTDGCDMTAYIVNPGIDGNVDGWTTEKKGKTAGTGGPLKPSNDAMEYWAGSTVNEGDNEKGFDYYQTITGLPNGAYTISADMLNSTNSEEGANWNGGGRAGLYANTTIDEVQQLINTDGETFISYTTDEIKVVDGTLRIGVKNVNSLTGRWFAADNFKLTYARQLTAEEAETIAKANAVAAYNEALAAAQAITAGTIPAAAYQKLLAVVTANTLTDGTSAEYNAAAAALNAAVQEAQSLVAPYATWLNLKTQALAVATGQGNITDAINNVGLYVETLTTAAEIENVNTLTTSMITNYAAWSELKKSADALAAVSNNNADANATLKGVITAQNNNVTNASVATQQDIAMLCNVTIPTATATLKAAMVNYVKTAQPTNDQCFDLTFMIVNQHFTEGKGGKEIPTGWTLESGSITEHRLLTHNFEAYHMTFNLSQTITGLPKGTYKVTLQGFARHDNKEVTDKTNLYCGIVDQKIKDIKDEYSTTPIAAGKPAMGDNNGEKGYTLNNETVYQPNGMSGSYYFFQEVNPATGKPFYTNEVQTLMPQDGDLKIGFKCETNTDWVIWDNFHLYYYGSAIEVTLDEKEGTALTEEIDNANVTLKKTIYEGWNTVTLPFNATKVDLGASKLYKYTGDVEGVLNFTEADAIEANVPYLMKAAAASTEAKTFKGVTVKAATDLKAEGENYDFVGVYATASLLDGDYLLGEDAFYRSAGNNNKVKAYRAYIQKKTAPAGTPEQNIEARLVIAIDGMATAINAIDGRNVSNDAVYNLSGQKVMKAQKGIFIQNGKKVVIK